jgi:hypothetical protein
VKAALDRGERLMRRRRPITARRSSTGGLGNLGLPEARARLRRAQAWNRRERRFDQAIRRLAGR